ncbi:MAG: DNA mismatch repair endonuclease MutL [Janthinobacterium lividum]
MPARIRLLSERLVNRIAAGEVIERPAAVVKELVENALDAGATRIAVTLEGGGIDRILVEDDGHGMGAEDLALAVQRHCTSKLADETLVLITTLGFRGEALPSIGAAARLEITSRPREAAHGHRIRVEGGRVGAVTPAPAPPGTRVMVTDLFYATPARRKFLKQPRTEAEHAEQAVTRLAFAAPQVAMRCTVEGRVAFDLPAQDAASRVAALLGPEAAALLLPVSAERGALRLRGFAAVPSHSRASAALQSMVVNGRPVADPVLRTAVRVAYRDVIEAGRHAVVALVLELPADTLDVNVHPAKTELRFQDAAGVRALVIGGLRQTLAVGAGEAGAGKAVLGHAGIGAGRGPHLQLVSSRAARPVPRPFGFAEAVLPLGGPGDRGFALGDPTAFALGGPAARALEPALPRPEHPLGAAVAQVLDTYILAVSATGNLVLVDQHAAHERLTHEALRTQHEQGGVRSQPLLLPAVVELAPAESARLLEAAPALARLGLEIEAFGSGALLVRALPAALGTPEPAPLLRDIADALAETGEATPLAARLDAMLARLACHGSIRAGRRMNQAEMDALLRQMEATPRAATCSHGRPTVLTLSKAEIEAMFGRR